VANAKIIDLLAKIKHLENGKSSLTTAIGIIQEDNSLRSNVNNTEEDQEGNQWVELNKKKKKRKRDQTQKLQETPTIATHDPQGRDYIGLTEGTFKKRFTQHKSSFNNIDYSNKTSLSKYAWSLKNEGKEYKICWSSIDIAKAYNNGSNKCGLCLC
jgi:C4-type Zn-finger protein